MYRIGRTNDEQRKVYLKTGIISQAKGSAYLELGDTKVGVNTEYIFFNTTFHFQILLFIFQLCFPFAEFC